MHWIYLSPHLDDAVYSCGGLIWQQTRSGDAIEIWTLCAGDPLDDCFSAFALELHQRWETPQNSVARRREEDQVACRILGASPRYFPVPDCIYRRPRLDYWALPVTADADCENSGIVMYPDRDALFGPLHPLEAGLPEQIARRMADLAPPDARLVSPLTLGGHVDHRLARLVAERLSAGRRLPLWYYADYPYAADHLDEIDTQAPSGWCKEALHLEDAAVEAWVDGIAAYATQISTFWGSQSELRTNLSDYLRKLGGGALWGPP